MPTSGKIKFTESRGQIAGQGIPGPADHLVRASRHASDCLFLVSYTISQGGRRPPPYWAQVTRLRFARRLTPAPDIPGTGSLKRLSKLQWRKICLRLKQLTKRLRMRKA
jgi:hypothetical protein